MINDKVLTNLGIISLIGTSPRSSKQAIDGTLFQDTRLNLESKLLSLISRNFDKLKLWKYIEFYQILQSDRSVKDIRMELEAQLISSSSFERHILPRYIHQIGNCYVLNPNQDEELFLYYNLSPSMVIEISRELLDIKIWFLGNHEVLTSEPLGDIVLEVRRRYNGNN